MKTVSLELAKRMKELGWKRETKTIWSGESEHEAIRYTGIQWKVAGTFPKIWLPAPTLTEIWDELPIGVQIYKLEDGSNKSMASDLTRFPIPKVEHENPAEALGLLWCKLKEEGII